MGNILLATMITTTTYGTWLPGDLRGYVEDARVFPSSPTLYKHAESNLRDKPVFLSKQEQDRIYEALLAAVEEFEYRLWAVSVESWHLHWLIEHHQDPVSKMVGRLKTRMRKSLDRGRIWTKGFDKRYCYSQDQVEARMAYIARHDGYRPLPPASWRIL